MTHISDASEHGCEAASTDLLPDQVGPYPFLVIRRRILPPSRIPLRRRSLRVPCVRRRVLLVGRGGVIAVARSGCSGSVSGGGLLDGHVRPAERVCLRSPCAALPVLESESGVRRGERDGRDSEMIAVRDVVTMATSTCRKLPATRGRALGGVVGRITAPNVIAANSDRGESLASPELVIA